MPEIASLWVRLGVTGDGTVQSSLARTKRGLKETADAGEQAATALRSFGRISLFEAAFAAQALLGSIQQLGQAMTALSGVGLAARFQRLEVGFTNILGSAQKAGALIEELRRFGATTEFNTFELAEFSKLLLATGSGANSVVREMKALSDAVSFSAGSTSDIGALAMNLSQIRNSLKPELEDLKQFSTRGIDLARVTGTANTAEAMQKLQGMSGREAFDTLITGFERAFGGTAQKNAASFLGVVQNLGEAFGSIMVPTGRLLLSVLQPIAGFLKTGAELVGWVNKMTGGVAGLAAVGWGLARVWPLVTSGFQSALLSIRELTAALYALSGAAATATAATGASAAGSAAAGAAGAGGLRGLLGGLIGGALWSGPGAMAKGVFGALKGFLGSGLGRGVAGLGVGFGSALVGDKIGGFWGDLIKNIGGGAGIGMIFGPKGALAGAILGGLKTAYDYTLGGAGKSAQDSENLKKSADALQDIKAAITGGGARSRRAVSSIEVEFAFAKALATGIG